MAEEKYIEFIYEDDKPKSSSVIEGLSSLETFGNLASKASGKIKLGEGKKKKKDKKEKKEKKKKKKDSLLNFDFEPLLPEGPNDESSELPGNGIIDISLDGLVEELYAQEEDGIDPLVEKERRSYKKKKKDKNPFKQEFAEELTILYDLYGNMSDVIKHLEKVVKQNDGSKVRGMSKYFNDAIMNLISARNTQLSIVKEMSSVKKTVADLKFKEDAAKAKLSSNEESNMNHQAAALLQQIMGVNRTQYLETVRGTSRPAFLVDSFTTSADYEESGYNSNDYEDPSHADDDDALPSILDLKDNYAGYSDDEIEDINQAIAQRIQAEGNDMRSPKGTAYIKYESRGVEVKIRKDIDSNEFDFIAVDRDGQVIYDYPLPENPGKIKFNGPIATDRFGNTYKVIEYSSSQLNG